MTMAKGEGDDGEKGEMIAIGYAGGRTEEETIRGRGPREAAPQT